MVILFVKEDRRNDRLLVSVVVRKIGNRCAGLAMLIRDAN
jgi:hypothetical protein